MTDTRTVGGMRQKTDIQPLAVGSAEAAAILGISQRMLRYLVADGVIPSFKVGARRLFRLVDLESWVAEQVEENLIEELV